MLYSTVSSLSVPGSSIGYNGSFPLLYDILSSFNFEDTTTPLLFLLYHWPTGFFSVLSFLKFVFVFFSHHPIIWKYFKAQFVQNTCPRCKTFIKCVSLLKTLRCVFPAGVPLLNSRHIYLTTFLASSLEYVKDASVLTRLNLESSDLPL